MQARKQKGFTQIPNDILEQLFSSQLTAKQLRVMLLTLRYGPGFHKDKALIPQNKFFEICGIASKEMKEVDEDAGPIGQLLKANVLRKYSSDPQGIKYDVNPDTDEWEIPIVLQARHNQGQKESEEQRQKRLGDYRSGLASLAAKNRRPEKPP